MPPALPPSVNTADNDPALLALPALLAGHSAWSLLDASARAALAPQWQQRPMAPGEVLLPQGELHTRLGMVLAGSVTLRDPDLGHAVQLQRGQMFGFGATPERHLATWQAQAATGGAVAWLAPEVLQQLRQVRKVEDVPPEDHQQHRPHAAQDRGNTPQALFPDGLFRGQDHEEIQAPEHEIPACTVPKTSKSPHNKKIS